MADDLATLIERLADANHAGASFGLHLGSPAHTDIDAVDMAMWGVLAAAVKAPEAEKLALRDLAAEFDAIANALRSHPSRPSDDDLCRRFVERTISRATVRILTGWNRDQLWSECLQRGLDPFA